jgi:hypothetical protein
MKMMALAKTQIRIKSVTRTMAYVGKISSEHSAVGQG